MIPPILCLMGPTASGKTQLAVELVARFPFEIISVDSAMVYKKMDIGTAKPSADILKKAPHRLINIREPGETYSAAQFRQDALREIKDIIANKKIPLLVGGTMLYFQALQEGLSHLPSANIEIRKKINDEASTLGWDTLHQRLKKIDPLAAQRIHPNDSQRIQRALEVHILTGKSLTQWQEESGEALTHYKIFNLALVPNDRAILHARIAERFKQMLAAGLVDEVRELISQGDLTPDMPAMRSVGYRQVWHYLQHDFSYEEMQERGIIATRQLAKRQLTWLRRWKEITLFDSENANTTHKIFQWISSNVNSG